MKTRLVLATLLALGAAVAQAQPQPSTASATASMLPVASAATLSAGMVAAPVLLSVGSGLLVVKGVEASARGSVYVLERVADGARTSVEVSGRAVQDAGRAVGQAVTVSAIGAGTVLSVAGEVIAFIQHAAAAVLLHDERVTP